MSGHSRYSSSLGGAFLIEGQVLLKVVFMDSSSIRQQSSPIMASSCLRGVTTAQGKAVDPFSKVLCQRPLTTSIVEILYLPNFMLLKVYNEA